jgi:hypothetical protein
MFSAIYFVCMVGQPCQFFVDRDPYPTMEVCLDKSAEIVIKNQLRVDRGEIPKHTVEVQCVPWDKA